MDAIFEITIPQTTIGFGAVNRLGKMVKELGGSKALIVTEAFMISSGLIDMLTKPLTDDGIAFGVFDKCKPNAPIAVIEACAQMINHDGFDLLIGLGGGSIMDTVKLAAVVASENKDLHNYLGPDKEDIGRPRISKILIPTTAGSGSEWSRNAVFKDEASHLKFSLSTPNLLAQRVIIDPELTLHLPPTVTADTGIDALSHAIEAYTALKATVVSDMFAEKVMQLVPDNLRAAYTSGYQNPEARYNMMMAAALSLASAMSTGGGGVLAHGMAYPLIDMAPAPVSHGISVSILLPYVMEFQLITNLSKFARIAELMGENIEKLTLREAAGKSVASFRRLSLDVGMPQRMRDVGIKKEDIPALVDSFFELRRIHADTSCRISDRDAVTHLFESAW